MCENDYGAFLPANQILSVTPLTSAPFVSTTPSKRLLVSSEKAKTAQDFYLDDRVVVFDKDGCRIPGLAKWIASGKEYGLNSYILGIETVRI